jgi:O-antigen/teichoic acid export membrane protein
MKRHIDTIKGIVFSGTAKDTFILFTGNLGSAFWGFLFTLLVARSLSIYDFGIFSAVVNLVNILSSLADLGISSGAVNFVAEHWGKGDRLKADEYVKASFVLRLIISLLISATVLLLAPYISTKLLASNDSRMAMWTSAIVIFWFFDLFFPYILQAKKMFLSSVIYDNSYYVGRLLFAFAFYMMGVLTLDKAFWAFGAGFLVTVIFTLIYVKTDFLKTKPQKAEYIKLLKFSGWIGVNRIVSSVSGRIDVQMLAAMIGAVATGLYSIPSRLASFIIVLAGSFSSVLATRLASFGDREKEKKYIIKSSLALLPITAGIILWIIIAKPFMVILFGEKYLPAVPIFQALAAAQIPFLFTVPAVSAIIYSMKKTVYIGTLSFFQLAAIFALNFYLIPKYGVFGPTITFGVTNTLLAVYVWFLVIRHYWIQKE